MHKGIWGLLGFLATTAAFAGAAGEQVVAKMTITDGTVVNFPECPEGQTPGFRYWRPENGPIRVGGIQVTTERGTWTFHVQQAWWQDGQPLRSDQLNQVQIPAELYCSPSGS